MSTLSAEPFKNERYIFAILPNAFVSAGSLHAFRHASLRQFPNHFGIFRETCQVYFLTTPLVIDKLLISIILLCFVHLWNMAWVVIFANEN